MPVPGQEKEPSPLWFVCLQPLTQLAVVFPGIRPHPPAVSPERGCAAGRGRAATSGCWSGQSPSGCFWRVTPPWKYPDLCPAAAPREEGRGTGGLGKASSCFALTLLGNALFRVARLCSPFSGDVPGERSFPRSGLHPHPSLSLAGSPRGSTTKGWGSISGAFPWNRDLIPQRQQPCPGSALPSGPDLSLWDPRAGDGSRPLSLSCGGGPAGCSCTGRGVVNGSYFIPPFQ